MATTSCKNMEKTMFILESTANRNANTSEKVKKSLHVQQFAPPPERQRFRNTSPTCHYCGKTGHVRTDCSKLKIYTMHDPAPYKSRNVNFSKRDKNLTSAPKYASPLIGQRYHKENYVCYNCGKVGHIRPNCYQLRRHPMRDE